MKEKYGLMIPNIFEPSPPPPPALLFSSILHCQHSLQKLCLPSNLAQKSRMILDSVSNYTNHEIQVSQYWSAVCCKNVTVIFPSSKKSLIDQLNKENIKLIWCEKFGRIIGQEIFFGGGKGRADVNLSDEGRDRGRNARYARYIGLYTY